MSVNEIVSNRTTLNQQFADSLRTHIQNHELQEANTPNPETNLSEMPVLTLLQALEQDLVSGWHGIENGEVVTYQRASSNGSLLDYARGIFSAIGYAVDQHKRYSEYSANEWKDT